MSAYISSIVWGLDERRKSRHDQDTAMLAAFDGGTPGDLSAYDEKLVCEPGTVLASKYVLERPAGFGGMSQIWVATNKATGAEVCVKVLVPTSDAEADQEAVQRFRREAHAAARLSHRAIVSVFDLLELDVKGATVSSPSSPAHAYAIVMELLKGETLGDMLAKREGGRIPLDEALDIFLPIMSALAHAHRASVIHRDIKPDNIFLAKDPDDHLIPKVLDFGVSKLPFADAITIDGMVVGTPSFMSPEQAKGARVVDARSDVFSAGILFYLMLSGENPFEDSSSSSSEQFATIVEAVLRREVPPPEVLDGQPVMWAVLRRALEKDPSARWNDCTEMGIALRKAAGRKSTTESNPMIMPPVEPISQRTLERVSGAPASSSSSSSSSTPASQSKRAHLDSNVSVPPFAPTSSPPKVGALSSKRNLVIGIVAIVSVLFIASFFVKVRFAAPAKEAAASTAAQVVAPPEPPPPVAVPSAEMSAAAAAVESAAVPETPAVKKTSISKPKRNPARKPGDPNIARDPGF